MSITTRKGDQGNTRLYSGETVSKKDPLIWATGDVDELLSMLGVTYAAIANCYACTKYEDYAREDLWVNKARPYLMDEITYIQRKLCVVASEIATKEPKLSKLPERIDQSAMDYLDTKRDILESQVSIPKGFILQGQNQVSAYLDVCRALSRRVERVVTGLYDEKKLTNKFLLMWMNRLSDYLYLLARHSENNIYRMVRE